MKPMNPSATASLGHLPRIATRAGRGRRGTCVAGALMAGAMALARGQSPAPPAPAAVLGTMVAVATWQEAHPSHWPDLDWTRAPYYLGLLATTRATGDERWADAVRAIGRKNDWRLGQRPFMADDHAVGQAWLALYQQDQLPEQRARVEAGIRSFAARPVERSLAWQGRIYDREWAWCDALFMSPQVLAGMTTVSGDRKWLDQMDRRYWQTCRYLLDRQESLFIRDGSYLPKREANGAKVCWSRGNGWVFAGLVHILQQMPADYPPRAGYVDLFRALAKRLMEIQQPDGSWHASLLDPASFPAAESSGTAFFCYGLLWGSNQGLLGRDAAMPAALRAWRVLAQHVQPDGMLGFVQPCGVSPRQVTAEMTEVYGPGGLLLAASELYNHILLDGARHGGFQLRNPTSRNRLREVTSLPWSQVLRMLPAPVPARLAVRDCQTGEFVASEVRDDDGDGTPDQVLFRATVLPDQLRDYELVETPASALPPPPSRLRGASTSDPLIIQIRKQ